MPRTTTRILAGLALAAPFLSPALTSAEGVHEHGTGQLNLVVDGNAVQVELTAPGADVVGFEHKPETDAAKAAVLAAAEQLEAGDTLFLFPEGAGCRLEDADVNSGLLAGLDHDDHDHGDHGQKKDDDHDHDHDKHDHDKHQHDDEHTEAHAEFRVVYRFACADGGAIDGFETAFFATFPNAARLQVQAITASGQHASDLTADSAALAF